MHLIHSSAVTLQILTCFLLATSDAIPILFKPSSIGVSEPESTVCKEGDLNKLFGYSGFKIQRHVVLKGMKPPLLHFVSLSNCDQGELVYERLERTGRETDIEWDKPMCFLGSKRITDDKGVVVSKQKTKTKTTKEKTGKKADEKKLNPVSKLFKLRNITLIDLPNKPHAYDPFKQPKPPQVLEKRSTIRDKFLTFLKKISQTRFIEYFQDSEITPYEDLQLISYSDINTDDIEGMHCYKFARRKKYALRDLMIYAPLTWVGGLFECNASDEEKKNYLSSLKSSNQFSKPYEIQCSANNSTPLYPLIADDITSIQYEYSKGSLTTIRTPYLYTPTNMDPRFGKPTKMLGLANGFLKSVINKHSSDKLPYDNWFQEVDVNEHYTYTPDDLSKLSNVVTNATQILKAYILSNPALQWDWDNNSVFGESEKEKPHYLELKALFSMTRIKERALKLDFVKSLQQGWDDLKLSSEAFKYKGGKTI